MNIVSSQPKVNTRIGLIIASILYLFIAVIGTLIAVRQNLPSRTFIPAFITGKPALEDFLTGNGTALSPPLYLCLVEVVLVVLACLPNRSAMIGIVGLTILGTIYLCGILVERHTYQVLNAATFDFSLTLVELLAIILPLLIIIFGAMEIAHRRSRSL
jgi:hypothetical protein